MGTQVYTTTGEVLEKKIIIPDDIKNTLMEELQEMFHTQWLAKYKSDGNVDKDGNLLPRFKKRERIIDQEVVEVQDDIAVPYNSLSPEGKENNKFAAEQAIIAYELYPTEQEKGANYIHIKWMENNPWDLEKKPELFVPYEELTKVEKDKDRIQWQMVRNSVQKSVKEGGRRRKRRRSTKRKSRKNRKSMKKR